MINLERISSFMKGLKNIGFSLFVLLILSGSFLAFLQPATVSENIVSEISPESIEPAQIQKPVYPNYLEIEANNFSQTISEVHRLCSTLILSSRFVPHNFNFRGISSIRKVIDFCCPVSIFIRGHALLN
jgi:hypothetical protein